MFLGDGNVSLGAYQKGGCFQNGGRVLTRKAGAYQKGGRVLTRKAGVSTAHALALITGPWPWAMAQGHGPWPKAHGPWPWVGAMAFGHGPMLVYAFCTLEIQDKKDVFLF